MWDEELCFVLASSAHLGGPILTVTLAQSVWRVYFAGLGQAWTDVSA